MSSMRQEKTTSTSAKILYRPVGISASIAAGVISGRLFEQVWKHATAGPGSDPPKALESEYPMRQVVVAAAVQGMIFAAVKSAIDRGGARLFEKWTGEWPGN